MSRSQFPASRATVSSSSHRPGCPSISSTTSIPSPASRTAPSAMVGSLAQIGFDHDEIVTSAGPSLRLEGGIAGSSRKHAGTTAHSWGHRDVGRAHHPRRCGWARCTRTADHHQCAGGECGKQAAETRDPRCPPPESAVVTRHDRLESVDIPPGAYGTRRASRPEPWFLRTSGAGQKAALSEAADSPATATRGRLSAPGQSSKDPDRTVASRVDDHEPVDPVLPPYGQRPRSTWRPAQR